MAVVKKWVVGAEVPSAGLWAATIIVPTTDPVPALRAVARQMGSRVEQVSARAYSMSKGDRLVRVEIATSRRAGGRLSSFVLGCTTFLRGNVQPNSEFDVERLCWRIQSHSQSIVNVVAKDESLCNLASKALLQSTYGMAFDTSNFHMPCGPVMNYASGTLDAHNLRTYYSVLVLPPSTARAMEGFPGASAVWGGISDAKSAVLKQAFGIAHGLARFKRFVELGWKLDTEPARLQARLASAVDAAPAFVVFEAGSSRGMTAATTANIRSLARRSEALLFDDFGVRDSRLTTLFPIP